MLHKIEKKSKKYDDAHAIINSLSYLSNEASLSGLDDLCVAIQTLIDAYPRLRSQDASDPESELSLIVSLLMKYKQASPKAREQFLSCIIED